VNFRSGATVWVGAMTSQAMSIIRTSSTTAALTDNWVLRMPQPSSFHGLPKWSLDHAVALALTFILGQASVMYTCYWAGHIEGVRHSGGFLTEFPYTLIGYHSVISFCLSVCVVGLWVRRGWGLFISALALISALATYGYWYFRTVNYLNELQNNMSLYKRVQQEVVGFKEQQNGISWCWLWSPFCSCGTLWPYSRWRSKGGELRRPEDVRLRLLGSVCLWLTSGRCRFSGGRETSVNWSQQRSKWANVNTHVDSSDLLARVCRRCIGVCCHWMLLDWVLLTFNYDSRVLLGGCSTVRRDSARYRNLSPAVRPRASYLDVGCLWGYVVSLARSLYLLPVFWNTDLNLTC